MSGGFWRLVFGLVFPCSACRPVPRTKRPRALLPTREALTMEYLVTVTTQLDFRYTGLLFDPVTGSSGKADSASG